MTTTTTLEQIKANFSEVTTNIIDGMDLYDYNHQCADSNENVIFYHKAWAKVNNATCTELENAEDQLKDIGFEFTDTNELMTKLAFFIVLEEYREQHEQEIKEDLEVLKAHFDKEQGNFEWLTDLEIGKTLDDEVLDMIVLLEELV